MPQATARTDKPAASPGTQRKQRPWGARGPAARGSFTRIAAAATACAGRVVRLAILAALPVWPALAQQPADGPRVTFERVPPETPEALKARIGRVAAQAEAIEAEPECRALIGHAAALALADAANEEEDADEAYALAAHDFAARAMRRCPNASYGAYWQGVESVAGSLASAAPDPAPEDKALADQDYLREVKPALDTLNLSRACGSTLVSAIQAQLARDIGGQSRRLAAGYVGRYAVDRCPEAALARVWPEVEAARRRLRFELRKRLGERLVQRSTDRMADLAVDAECKRRVLGDLRFALLPAPAEVAEQRAYVEAGHRHAAQTAAACPRADLDALMGRVDPSSWGAALQADNPSAMAMRTGHKLSAAAAAVWRTAEHVREWGHREIERSRVTSACGESLELVASSRLYAAAGLPVSVGLPVVLYDLKQRCPPEPMTSFLSWLETQAEAVRSELHLPTRAQGAPRRR